MHSAQLRARVFTVNIFRVYSFHFDFSVVRYSAVYQSFIYGLIGVLQRYIFPNNGYRNFPFGIFYPGDDVFGPFFNIAFSPF